jgi:hypothetical protein
MSIFIESCLHKKAIEAALQLQRAVIETTFSKEILFDISTIIEKMTNDMQTRHYTAPEGVEWCGHQPLKRPTKETR